MFSLKYKSVKQSDMKDCGAACIATILKQYKSYINISTIRELAGTNDLGTNVMGIVKTLEHFNFESKAVNADMSIFEDESLPYPAIAHVIKEEVLLHFVVIHKVEKNNILIADPAEGLILMKKTDFEKIWSKVIIYTVPKENYIEIKEKENSLTEILKLLFKDNKLIFHIVISALVVTVLGIISSFYFQTLIDSVIPSSSLSTLNVLSIGIIFLYLFQSFFDFLKSYLLTILGNRMSLRLMLGYYNHVLRLPFHFFVTRKSGEIISRFSDASKVVNALASSLLTIILDVSMIVIISFIMYFQNAELFLLALISIPIYVIIIFSFIKKFDTANHKEMEDNAILNSFIIESLNGIETIKSLQAEEHASKKVDSLFVNYIQAMFQNFQLNNIQTFLKSSIQLLTSSLVLWIGARLVIDGTLSLGQLLTFNTLVNYFSTPLQNIINLQPQIQTAKVAAERLGEVMTISPELGDNEEKKVSFKDFSEISIHANRLSFNYPMQRECLNNINFRIESGEKVAFVGKSGSGKSTLAKLLLAYYEPTQGDISYNEYSSKNIDRNNLRQNIVLIPQTTFFFSGTIFENLTFGIEKNVDLKRVIEACKMACIDEDIEALPLSYNSVIEENGSNFSGGQKQRLALARTLLRTPSVLILDESTSSIDGFTEKEIMKNLFTLDGITIIVIAHRLSILKRFSRIYVLENKTIVEEGIHKELLDQGGVYKKLWKLQR